MEVLAALAAWAFRAFTSPSTGLSALNSTAIASQLVPQLSKHAAIFTPGTPQFANATDRWSAIEQPGILLVVQTASEKDVSQVVQFANKENIPYLAVGRAHGGTDTLSQVKNGIQIWTTRMNSIEIAPDGQSVVVGAGVMTKNLTDALWAVNKQTVTGVCECTGILGPALGGGHGFLQGHHGLVTDQIIEARVVLENGTAVTTSETSNPDLYYALKGAGHNFGIVTSLRMKIYDVKPGDMWTYQSLIFTQDKLEGVYTAFNALTKNGTQSADLMNYSFFLRMPAVDPVNPVILVFILYANSPAAFNASVAPFHALGPVATDGGQAEYPALAHITLNGMQDPACAHGSAWQRYPVGLQEYDVKTQRSLFTAYTDLTAQYRALNNSAYIFEGYPVLGVKAIPEDSTAYSFRSDNLLLSSFLNYVPNPALDPVAQKFGQQARKLLVEGSGSSELHAYVNYAHGDEGVESWYGYDTQKLDKLRALKKQFDPNGKFSFYGPIY